MAHPYLDGKMLIAMPGIGDERFERAVIYVCAHSTDGAMGLIVNHEIESLSLGSLLDRLDLAAGDDAIRLPDDVASTRVMQGGPVETSRGFVLHSKDYFSDEATLSVDKRVGLTATLDVLRTIASGRGPRLSLLALGYTGWGPGQLESEIRQNGWLTCDADDELIFGQDLEAKYPAALARIGINEDMLSGGHFGNA
jgi:putative transcriptional regulator